MSDHHWFWQSRRASGRINFNKLFRPGSSANVSSPPPKITNKLVSETFWPDTLDKESSKAARILYSFSKYGMYQDEARDAQSQTLQKQKMWSRIPEDVFANAKGIVIFTVMRSGLWVSGAGGSGVVVVRTPKGNWSWPLAIEIHTAELGFLVGVDIYDCVLVLNTSEAVEAFSKSRCIIGGDLYATPGPLGVGWFFDKDTRTRQAPIFSYLRSRSYYAAVQLDHAVVVHRSDENNSFYQVSSLLSNDIFSGNHNLRPESCFPLLETLRASEGATDVDETLLATGLPPSDFEVVEEGHAFGVPDKEDPDPYGVLALEKQGFLIREAGTKTSPTSDTFEFSPNLTSPAYRQYNRRSSDNLSLRSSWRRSVVSSSADRQDASSIISRDADRTPGTPENVDGSSYFRVKKQNDGIRAAPGTPNLVPGEQYNPGETDWKRESASSATLMQKANGVHQRTIYEDEGEADHSIVPPRDSSREPATPTGMFSNPFSDGQSGVESAHDIHKDEHNGLENQQDDVSPTAVLGQLPITNKSDDQKEESQVESIKDSNSDDQHQTYDDSADHIPAESYDALGITPNGGEKKLAPEPLTIRTTNLESNDSDDEGDDDGSFMEAEESPVEIHDVVFQGGPTSVYQTAATINQPKAKIVNVIKPPPPVVPTRNPGRARARPNSENASTDNFQQPESSADQEPVKSERFSAPIETSNGNFAKAVTPSSETFSSATSTSKAHDEALSPAETSKPTTPEDEYPGSDQNPPVDENQKPVAPRTSLINIHKGLNASPSPASSPEDNRGYF